MDLQAPLHPDLWAMGNPIFRGRSVHDGPEVLDGSSLQGVSRFVLVFQEEEVVQAL